MTNAMDCLGQLKLSLMNSGVYASDAVRKNAGVAEGICRENDRQEIVFALADDFFVHTFLTGQEQDCPRLEIHDANMYLVLDAGKAKVSIIPPSQFLARQRETRSPVAANMELDGYCLNFFLRTVGKQNDLNMAQGAVLSVIQSAFEAGVADLVQVNMDYCNEADRGFSQFAPMLEAIKKQFSAFVAFRGFPPDSLQTIDSVYAAGADLIVYPLQGFFGDTRLERIMPEAQVFKSLEYAVGVFPDGSVFTEVNFADSPEDPIMQTIDRLTQAGVIPFIKLPQNGVKDGEEYDRLKRVAGRLADAAQKNKLNLKWLYPSSRFLTPLDAGFYTGPGETARLALRPVYKSALGKKTSEGFAALRRKLRVKNISDSYESAGL